MACSRMLSSPCLSSGWRRCASRPASSTFRSRTCSSNSSGISSAEREALGEAVASPTISDAMARFRLSGGLLKSFEREADRTGLPIVTLMHRSASDSASVFDGRAKEALPKPMKLAAPRRKWLRR